MIGQQVIAPGGTAIIGLSGNDAQLSNKGGIISLIDPAGLKVDGVSYTKSDVQRQGWTLVF